MADNVQYLQKGSRPIMVDHTPSSDIAATDVVVIGDVPFIAHLDLEANELGALAAGGGVYRAPKDTGEGEAIAGGTEVYWDAGDSQVTTTEGGNAHFGYTAPEGAGDDDATVEVIHAPKAITGAT